MTGRITWSCIYDASDYPEPDVDGFALCEAQYDGDMDDKRTDRTHVCDLDKGHTGDHRCRRCGHRWSP